VVELSFGRYGLFNLLQGFLHAKVIDVGIEDGGFFHLINLFWF
jgi:hypothetical protein